MKPSTRPTFPKRWKKTNENTFDRLRKMGIPRHQAKWKAHAIDQYKEGEILGSGYMYQLFVGAGMHPVDAFVQEACFWVDYDKTIGVNILSMGPDEKEALYKRARVVKFPIIGL